MKRPISIYIWSAVGFTVGAILWFLLFAHLVVGAGMDSYYNDAIVIGVVDVILSLCAALFYDIIVSFVVSYSLPFTLWAVVTTLSLLNIEGILFWWGFATAIFLVGLVSGLGGRSLRKWLARRRAQTGNIHRY